MAFLRALTISRSPAAALAAVGVVWGSMAAMLPQLKEEIGLSDAALGGMLFLSAAGALTAMATAPRVGAALPRIALPLAGAVLAVPTFFLGFGAGAIVFAITLMIFGAATGLLDILGNARIAEVEAQNDVGLMNLNHATYSFTYAAVAAIAGLAREAEWSSFAWFAVISLACLVLVPIMAIDRPVIASPDDAPKQQGTLPPAVWILGAITMVSFFAENTTESWSALHIERTLGQGAALGALGPSMLGLTMGIGRLAGHFITPRGGEVRIMRVACVIASAGLAIAAFAPVVWMAYLGFGLLGIGVSVMAPLALAVAGQSVGEADRARAVSRAAIFGYAGFFFGPPVMGILAELAGLRIALAFAAAVLLVVTLALLPLLRRG